MNHLFSINGEWLRPPDGYQESPVPVVGYNLRGEPIRQGFPSIIFTWSFMRQEELTALLDAFDPEEPQVLLQYISASTGELTSKYAMIEEPVIGARMIVYYQSVALRATRITENP